MGTPQPGGTPAPEPPPTQTAFIPPLPLACHPQPCTRLCTYMHVCAPLHTLVCTQTCLSPLLPAHTHLHTHVHIRAHSCPTHMGLLAGGDTRLGKLGHAWAHAHARSHAHALEHTCPCLCMFAKGSAKLPTIAHAPAGCCMLLHACTHSHMLAHIHKCLCTLMWACTYQCTPVHAHACSCMLGDACPGWYTSTDARTHSRTLP